MKTNFPQRIICLFLFFSPVQNFGQAPDLGSTANFVLFTTTGAVSSTGITDITGDVGSGTGAISGFAALHGTVYNADAVTAQASLDLLALYNQLNSYMPDFFPGPVLGNGQILLPGAYLLPAAASLNGNLYLDAQGDPDALFIFQIGGAFSTNAASEVILLNGALARNIFWKVEGAVPMTAGSTMRGTIVANNAAISLGANCILEGRALSTTGAVSIYNSAAFIQPGTILPVTFLSFTGICDHEVVLLNWSTSMESNNDYFSIERSGDDHIWIQLQKIQSKGNSSLIQSYIYRDHQPLPVNSYYRLKQTDLDGKSTFGNIASVSHCGNDKAEHISVYPNPSTTGKFELRLTGSENQVHSITIFNALGQKIYSCTGLQPNFDLSNQAAGVYFIQVRMLSNSLTLLRVIKK